MLTSKIYLEDKF